MGLTFKLAVSKMDVLVMGAAFIFVSAIVIGAF